MTILKSKLINLGVRRVAYKIKAIPEKQIENQILSYLKIMGAFVWKNDSVGIWDPKKRIFRKKQSIHHLKGVADILGVYKGKPLAIEVKSKTGRASKDQLLFLEAFKKHGGIAGVARSIDDVTKILSTQSELSTDN